MNAAPIVDQRLNLLRARWRRTAEGAPQDPGESGNRPTVAISRETGAGGNEVAREIGRLLQWPVYDRELIDMVAQESGLRAELVASVDEHDRGWLVDALASFKRHHVSSAEYVHHLVHVLNALTARGQCVIVGRGAAACLPPATTLRVRVVAHVDDRVGRIARDRDVTEAAARDVVQRLDQERDTFVASHFHRDIRDASNFDLVVNSSRLTVGACAELIVAALRAREIAAQTTESTSGRGPAPAAQGAGS